MRNVRTSWAALGCAVLLGACDILPHAMTATTVGFEVLEFSRQTQFPGVESNLYATEVIGSNSTATSLKELKGLSFGWIQWPCQSV